MGVSPLWLMMRRAADTDAQCTRRIIGARALQREQRVLVHEGGRSHCRDTRQSAHPCKQPAHDMQRQVGREARAAQPCTESWRLLHGGPADAGTHASVSEGVRAEHDESESALGVVS